MHPDAHIQIVGLQFGDEGKGSLVDYFCSGGANLVVRYNGGPQAAHNVRFRTTSGVIHHTFSQFGSGTLRGIPTLLSHFMSLDPPALLAEAAVLSDKLPEAENPLGLLSVDRRCLVITPFHRILNRIRERLRSERHGSCGVGVGEAVLDAEKGAPSLRWGDLEGAAFVSILREIQEYKMAEAAELLRNRRDPECAEWERDLHEAGIVPLFARKCAAAAAQVRTPPESEMHEMIRSQQCVFEGAQGVLLDRDAGFFPYVTPSTTTLKNAAELTAAAGLHAVARRVGVLRACTVRHGAGPMPSECFNPVDLRTLRDEDNVEGPWQGILRAGWLDMPALRYALSVCKVDELAVTNLDRRAVWKICEGYEKDGERIYALPWGARGGEITRMLAGVRPIVREAGGEDDLIREIESACGLPVKIRSRGPCAEDKSCTS